MAQIGGVCHQKCLGKGFEESDQEFMKSERCDRIVDYAAEESTIVEERCSVYTNPDLFWRPGFRCPMASHYRPDLKPEVKKGRVGQQKQKKRH